MADRFNVVDCTPVAVETEDEDGTITTVHVYPDERVAEDHEFPGIRAVLEQERQRGPLTGLPEPDTERMARSVEQAADAIAAARNEAERAAAVEAGLRSIAGALRGNRV